MGKFSWLRIVLPTTNVNHTALFKHAETLQGFKKGTFQKMYYTTPSTRGPKQHDTREHDEVISRSITAMDLKVQYVVGNTKQQIRYAVIYGQYRTGDADSEDALQKNLETFVRKFQRKPGPIQIGWVDSHANLFLLE